MNNPEDLMDIALEEARISLREGNSGFGAVIVEHGVIIAKAHDTDRTSTDPTAHAEMTVIRQAALTKKGDLSRCLLVSTHEPCPMCATAIVWSGIQKIAYGTSIQESLLQGRNRIDLSCAELFQRSGASIDIQQDIKKEACALLYNSQVRKTIDTLREADSTKLAQMANDLAKKRVSWYSDQDFKPVSDDCLDQAYGLFLKKLGISAAEAPVVDRQPDRLVIHSKNFCPTLEACNILGLDTRVICRKLTEGPTQELLQQLNPKLRFQRNYQHIRPHGPYCEEMIILAKT
ncbi:MAG: nucleoside deaminase [bacterium]